MDRRTFALGTAMASAGAAFGLTAVADAKPGSDKTFKVMKTPEEWARILTPEQFRVLRQHGTERPWSSALDKVYDEGIYNCAGCGSALFSSATKYDSRTGWPSFWKPLDGAVATSIDRKFYMVRTEVHCATCGGHLGHVFNDGPPPTGLRYCMNGVSLAFVPAGKTEAVEG